MNQSADKITTAWIRNPSDERAAANGCRFDVLRGALTVHWIERFAKIYQGDLAGQPLQIRGCHECGDYGLPALFESDWDEAAQAIAVERATRHNGCIAAGHRIDWQYDCTMRIFGWIRYSDHWRRWVRRFRQATIFIAKKNKKSPTLAAWGMYLLAGDGEPGQSVFFGAKDGTQAREIAATHTFEMLRQSPELSEVCKTNLNQMSVLHLPTRSILKPMSSSNSRTQQSKEGLNGCMLIDEIHVVDREFMGRISRAGISRSEPLQIEVSTAGNNPDGYGKERFDYCFQVEAGTVENDQLFAAVYAAPQDATDEALDRDPLKYARMANPALGHTVDEAELLHDYTTSRPLPGEFAKCKMYRFNIWQRSSNPWLNADHWTACRRKFTQQSLYGRPCWAGLDLSRTRDLTALVLVFRSPSRKRFLLLPYFWMPEERAKELHDKANFAAWAAAGEVFLTPGDVVDYGYIRAKIRELAKLFDIQELAYDPHYGEETTQSIEQGVCDDKGKQLEEAAGVPRFAFAQNDANFAAPTLDFEMLVRAGRMHHNGNRVLTWQIGHAHVIVRQNKVKRVVKEQKDSYKTVDGVVAAIEGLARATLGAEQSMPGALLL